MSEAKIIFNLEGIKITKEIKYNDGKYVGQVVNGKAEGKGIRYWDDGERYEGDFKNGKIEGKGIYYYNNGDRYEGNFKNNKNIFFIHF